MNLSIWILSDWLKDLVQEVRCKTGRMDIEGVRLFSSGFRLDRNMLYIGTSDDFFEDGSRNIVCRNQDDYLILGSTDLISTVNSIQDAFSYYNEWSVKCRTCIDGGTLKELLETSVELFPTPMIVVDAAQTFVAYSSPKADFQASDEWQESIRRGNLSDNKLKTFNLEHPEMYQYTHVFAVDPRYFFVKGFCKHIFINGARRASVILKDPDEQYSTGKIQLFDYFTDIVRDWIILCGDDNSSFKINSYFAMSLEGAKDAVTAMLRQTSLFGWDNKCKKVLFVLASVTESSQFDTHMISGLTQEADGTYAMVHNKRIVILANDDLVQASSFNNILNSFLNRQGCYGAVSFAFTDMSQISQAYKLALSALETSPAIAGVLYHCQDTSFRRIISIINEQAANTLQHPALAVLKNYDLRNRTDFCKTLFCYLKNERHHNHTAEELFIHRNTLFQRLQKIQDIWPLNLEDPEERFHLLISFYQDHFND